MYQIFINEKPLHILRHKKSEARKGHVVLHEPQLKAMLQWARKLEEDDSLQAVYAICKDPEATFKAYAAVHKNIDAAGGIVVQGDKLLFIKRFGKWDLPKGKLEKGEQTEAAALREVEEECGVNELQLQKYIATTYHTYAYQGGRALKSSHWYEMHTSFSGTLLPQLEEGITEVCWISRAALEEVFDNTYASISALLNTYLTTD